MAAEGACWKRWTKYGKANNTLNAAVARLEASIPVPAARKIRVETAFDP